MYTYTPGFQVALKSAIGAALLMLCAAVAFGDEHQHNHATKGPHGGPIIELGTEELHAELMHDDATGVVTVYLLDSEVKRYMTVATQEITINVRHDRKGLQFRLKSK